MNCHIKHLSGPMMKAMPLKFMITAFTGIGLDRLTDGKPAVISLTKEHILNEAATLFPPAKLIVNNVGYLR